MEFFYIRFDTTHFVQSENKTAESILNVLKFSNTAFTNPHTVGNYNSLIDY